MNFIKKLNESNYLQTQIHRLYFDMYDDLIQYVNQKLSEINLKNIKISFDVYDNGLIDFKQNKDCNHVISFETKDGNNYLSNDEKMSNSLTNREIDILGELINILLISTPIEFYTYNFHDIVDGSCIIIDGETIKFEL